MTNVLLDADRHSSFEELARFASQSDLAVLIHDNDFVDAIKSKHADKDSDAYWAVIETLTDNMQDHFRLTSAQRKHVTTNLV